MRRAAGIFSDDRSVFHQSVSPLFNSYRLCTNQLLFLLKMGRKGFSYFEGTFRFYVKTRVKTETNDVFSDDVDLVRNFFLPAKSSVTRFSLFILPMRPPMCVQIIILLLLLIIIIIIIIIIGR